MNLNPSLINTGYGETEMLFVNKRLLFKTNVSYLVGLMFFKIPSAGLMIVVVSAI